MSAVIGLGYALVEGPDLIAWKEFAADLLGLQVAAQTDDRLLLRMDERAYRLDIRRGDAAGVTALGWEVAGPADLEQLARALESHGYVVKGGDADLCHERQVSGLAVFHDREDQRLELFYGMKKSRDRFVSPTGARFVTGSGGLGHAFQTVRDVHAYNELYLDILGFKLSDYIELNATTNATFAHANWRHHSFAWAPLAHAPQGVAHLMFEVDELDLVGRAWDKVQAGAAPVAATFGKHSNDEMISFYVRTPSGFQVEYGFGGKVIDDATWSPSRYDAASYWGHKRTNQNNPDA